MRSTETDRMVSPFRRIPNGFACEIDDLLCDFTKSVDMTCRRRPRASDLDTACPQLTGCPLAISQRSRPRRKIAQKKGWAAEWRRCVVPQKAGASAHFRFTPPPNPAPVWPGCSMANARPGTQPPVHGTQSKLGGSRLLAFARRLYPPSVSEARAGPPPLPCVPSGLAFSSGSPA